MAEATSPSSSSSSSSAQNPNAATQEENTSAVNLSIIKDAAKNELSQLLNSVKGEKALVLDPDLIGIIGMIAPASFMKEHKVGNIFKLEPRVFDSNCSNIVFLTRPSIDAMKLVARQTRYLNAHPPLAPAPVAAPAPAAGARGAAQPPPVVAPPQEEHGGIRNYYLFLMPRRTLICERILEDEGVYGDIQINEYGLDLMPLDDDVLSMELPFAYRQTTLDGDFSSLYYIARAILQIEAIYGQIPLLLAKGSPGPKRVVELIQKMREDVKPEVANLTPEIDSLILIDRQIDPITPMLTQLSYEGLIDELFGIRHGMVEDKDNWTPAKIDDKGNELPRPKNVKIPLNSHDSVFAEIRDLNINDVGGKLNQKAKEIEEGFKEKQNLKTVGQIRDFMRKLPKLQEDKKNLEIHIKIVDRVKQMIGKRDFLKRVRTEIGIVIGEESEETVVELVDDMIGRQDPLASVLRLIALYSLTTGGLKLKTFDYLRREIIQSYGYEAMLTLNNLEKIGCIRKLEGRSPWPAIRRGFNLHVADWIASKNSVASVYNGFLPVVTRLVEAADDKQDQWRSIAEQLKLLPGQQSVLELPNQVPSSRKVTMIFLIGGITFGEISSLRRMAQSLRNRDGEARDYIIATTKIINGGSLVESCYEDIGDIMFR